MSKNKTASISRFYNGFFTAMPLLAVSPYAGAFMAGGALLDIVAAPDGGGPNGGGNFILNGVAACVILTVFPVLPVLTALTCGIVLIGSVLGGLSALLAYPLGMAVDLHNSVIEKNLSLQA